jgi:hypothetical protein
MANENDFQSARTQIKDLIFVLKSSNIDFVHFDDIFESACECMNELDVPIVQLRVSQLQVNRANPPATTPTEYYRRAIYLPLLDAVITDMQSRFGEETVSNFNELTYFISSIIAQSAEIPCTWQIICYAGTVASLVSQFTNLNSMARLLCGGKNGLA